MARRQHAIDVPSRGRSFEFAGFDGEEIWIVTVTKLPGCSHRLVVGHGLFRRVPRGLHGYFKVAERAAPGFDRARRHQGIPVQFVDRKATMLDGRQTSCQSHVLDMSVCTELQASEKQGDSPGQTSAKRSGEKVRYFQAPVVDPVASAAREAAGMEGVVGQS